MSLYDDLCKAVISMIIQAETNCEPEYDILLKLEAIIRQRDFLKNRLTLADKLAESCKKCANPEEHWAILAEYEKERGK